MKNSTSKISIQIFKVTKLINTTTNSSKNEFINLSQVCTRDELEISLPLTERTSIRVCLSNTGFLARELRTCRTRQVAGKRP